MLRNVAGYVFVCSCISIKREKCCSMFRVIKACFSVQCRRVPYYDLAFYVAFYVAFVLMYVLSIYFYVTFFILFI